MLKVDARQAALEHLSATHPAKTGNRRLSDEAEWIIGTPVGPTISPAVIVGVAQVAEALILVMAGILAYLENGAGDRLGFAASLLVGAVLAYSLLGSAAQTHRIGAYRTILEQIAKSLLAWTIVFAFIAVAALVFNAAEGLWKGWIIVWFVQGAVAIIVSRMILRSLVHNWTLAGRLKRRTVIVGGGADAEALIKAIREPEESDIELFGLFDDRVDQRSPDRVAGCPKLGTIADLIEFARRTRVDLVIVSMPLSAEKRVLEMLGKLWVLPVDIRLSAHMSNLKFTSRAYSYVGNVAVFDIADRPITDWNLVHKWFFDKLVALAAVVLFSPIMLATAIAIRIESPGPVIFRQKRHGFNNELIEVYKFRSMYNDMADADASMQVTRDDPRVTRVGRFIRKTSIDELPQFFNVLKGELSVIGPRPHALQSKVANRLHHEAVDGYFARHKVKPGITGWAQIHGWRGETDTVDKILQRVNHDLYYIENWSLALDLYILFMTPISLITRRENAY